MDTGNVTQKTLLAAIKQHCHGCSGFDKEEQKLCAATDCPLYQFRMGTKPKVKRSPAQLEAARRNIAKVKK